MKKPKRIRPVVCVWDGEHFIPLPRFRALCDQQFVVHEEYPMIPSEERSMSHHRGYFASLKECWNNLPEEDAGRFPSPEHLRAWALVETGFCSETDYVMDSDKEARRLAADLRRMNPYSIIRISANVVKHFEPESQAVTSANKERFAAQTKAVLDLAASMARTTPAELKKNSGRAA